MPSKTVTVGSSIGLHARPAAIIAEAVVNAGVPVTLALDGGEPVDAGSAPVPRPTGVRAPRRRLQRRGRHAEPGDELVRGPRR